MGLGDLVSTVITKFRADTTEYETAIKKMSGVEKKAAEERLEQFNKHNEKLEGLNRSYIDTRAKIQDAWNLASKAFKAYTDDTVGYAATANIDYKQLHESAQGLITDADILKLAVAGVRGGWSTTTKELDVVVKSVRALTMEGNDQKVVIDTLAESLSKGAVDAIRKFGDIVEPTKDKTKNLNNFLDALRGHIRATPGEFDATITSAQKATVAFENFGHEVEILGGKVAAFYLKLPKDLGESTARALLGSGSKTRSFFNLVGGVVGYAGGGALGDDIGAAGQAKPGDVGYVTTSPIERRRNFLVQLGFDEGQITSMLQSEEELRSRVKGGLDNLTDRELANFVSVIAEDQNLTIKPELLAKLSLITHERSLKRAQDLQWATSPRGILEAAVKKQLAKDAAAAAAKAKAKKTGTAKTKTKITGTDVSPLDALADGFSEWFDQATDFGREVRWEGHFFDDTREQTAWQQQLDAARRAFAEFDKQVASDAAARERKQATRAGQDTWLEQQFGRAEEFELYRTLFDGLTGSVTAGFDAWITGAKGVGAAMKEAIAGFARSLATEALLQALRHGAYALGSLAFGRVDDAAKHGVAAAKWAGVAAVAGVAAHSLMSGGGSSATSGGGARAGGDYTRTGSSTPGSNVTIILGNGGDLEDSPRARAQRVARALFRAEQQGYSAKPPGVQFQ